MKGFTAEQLVELLGLLRHFNRRELQVLAACAWFEKKNRWATRKVLERVSGLDKRNTLLVLGELEADGHISRDWNRSHQNDSTSLFFVRVHPNRSDQNDHAGSIETITPDRSKRSRRSDQNDPGSTSNVRARAGAPADPSIHSATSGRIPRSDPSVRSEGSGGDGRTDELKISKRVKKVFEQYWPHVPDIALRGALNALAIVDPTEAELCAFIEEAYRGTHRAFEGVAKAEFPFGASMTPKRFSAWRSSSAKLTAHPNLESELRPKRVEREEGPTTADLEAFAKKFRRGAP